MDTHVALLPDERVIMQSDKDILTLTTKRVRYNAVEFGSSHLISITLDSVASCSLTTRSFPILVLLAAAAIILALIMHEEEDAVYFLFFVAIVLGVVYFLTRRAVLIIASNGGEKIIVPIIRSKP